MGGSSGNRYPLYGGGINFFHIFASRNPHLDDLLQGFHETPFFGVATRPTAKSTRPESWKGSCVAAESI